MAWSPSIVKSTESPSWIDRAVRIAFGMVTWPFKVTLASHLGLSHSLFLTFYI